MAQQRAGAHYRRMLSYFSLWSTIGKGHAFFCHRMALIKPVLFRSNPPPCCVWVSPCITHTDPSQHTRRRQDCVSSSSWSIKSPTVEFLILSSSIPSEKKRLPNLIWTFKWNFFKIFWWKADSNSNWDRGEHASMLFLCCRGNHRNCERNTVGGRAAVNWDLSIDQLYRPTVPQCPVVHQRIAQVVK